MGREKFTQRCGLGICSRVASEDTPNTYMSCLDNQLVTIGTHCIDFVRTLKWRLPFCSSTALTKDFKLIFVSLTRTMLVFVVQQVNKLYCSILVIFVLGVILDSMKQFSDIVFSVCCIRAWSVSSEVSSLLTESSLGSCDRDEKQAGYL